MSSAATTDKRCSERVSLDISAVVRVKESRTGFWKETTDLVRLSRSGAGFYLEKQCEVGRLVSLMLPMPKHFRCYDHDKELYRVWGLVQHCSRVSGEGDCPQPPNFRIRCAAASPGIYQREFSDRTA